MTGPDEEKAPERTAPGEWVEGVGEVVNSAGNAADAVPRCDGCNGP